MWVCQLASSRATYSPPHTRSVGCVHRCRRPLDSRGQVLKGANPRGCQSCPFCRFAERPGACSIASWSGLMRRSPSHRVYIGIYRICPLSKCTEGLRGNAATILAAVPVDPHEWLQICIQNGAMPQHLQSAPLPRPHVVYRRRQLHTQCSSKCLWVPSLAEPVEPDAVAASCGNPGAMTHTDHDR